MLKGFCKSKTFLFLSGAVFIITMASCGNQEDSSSDSDKKDTKVTMDTEPKIKEVPIPGQMGAHGGMSSGGGGMGAHGGMSSGGGGMGAHGGMSSGGGGMGAHGGMSGGRVPGAHGGMSPEITAKELAEPLDPKRKVQRIIKVSKEIENKWENVTIHVRDKKSGQTEHYKVPVNGKFSVPNTDFTIKTGEFLPHFSMPTEGTITSASLMLENPALRVVISEKDEEKYKGWLFSKYPDMHSFEHEKYVIGLDDSF